MPAQIASVDVVRILGKLSDEGGEHSSRSRFIREFLSKYKTPETVISDIDGLLEATPHSKAILRVLGEPSQIWSTDWPRSPAFLLLRHNTQAERRSRVSGRSGRIYR
jgi:hypothetical protein